jgi:spermidine synthase
MKLIILDQQQTETLESGLKEKEEVRVVRNDLREIGIFTYRDYKTKGFNNIEQVFTRFFFSFSKYYMDKIR